MLVTIKFQNEYPLTESDGIDQLLPCFTLCNITAKIFKPGKKVSNLVIGKIIGTVPVFNIK